MDTNDPRSHEITRRAAMGWLGVGAAAALLPDTAFAQAPSFAKGAIIRTLLKDYAPAELAGGALLFHEHLSLAPDFMAQFVAAAAAARSANAMPTRSGAPAAASAPAGQGGPPPAPAGPDPMRDVSLMVEELAVAKREGVGCIVDGGHPDMGRDMMFLRQVAMKASMPIVIGGGFYSQPFYPREIATMSEEQIVQAIIRQVDADTVGVFGEIGSWDDITATERKVFRAIGRAHVATNIPIFTHTGIPGKSALEQLDILEDAA